jgi:hypothetical protein
MTDIDEWRSGVSAVVPETAPLSPFSKSSDPLVLLQSSSTPDTSSEVGNEINDVRLSSCLNTKTYLLPLQEASFSDTSGSAHLTSIDCAASVITILERQILVAESAYRSMVLAADGYRMYVLAVQNELGVAIKELERQKNLSRDFSVKSNLNVPPGEALLSSGRFLDQLMYNFAPRHRTRRQGAEGDVSCYG